MLSLKKINPQMILLQGSVVALLILLTGCTTSPDFDTEKIDLSLSPQRVIAEPNQSFGKTVLWGGTILNTANLQETTRLEVLAYPLDSSNRPQIENPPLGRFILHSHGYLEATTYAQGRIITVLGNVDGTLKGKVGKSSYTYPVVNSQQIHLWSIDSGQSRGSFHFGIGIGL